MKTYSPKPRDIERRWYVIDAQGAVLGRLASEVAKILRGKHKPIFAPHADTGDHVVVVNARAVRLTGSKEQEKLFYQHSGYPGGLRRVGYARLMAERPSLAVEKAVRGMLPKNRLGRQMIKKLAVYEGPSHPHQAQRPQALELGRLPKWEGLPKPKPPPAPAPKAARSPRRGRPAPEAATPGEGRTAKAGASPRAKPRTSPTKARASQPRKGSAGPRRGAAARTRTAPPTAKKEKRATAVAAAGTEQKPARTRRDKSTKES